MADPDRIDKLDEKVEKVKDDVVKLDRRVGDLETQLSRLISHVESEVGLARNDLARIEKKLFGEEDVEFGGKVGFLTRDINSMKIWFKAVISAAGIIVFLFGVYEFATKILK